jgi:hypothetical protein
MSGLKYPTNDVMPIVLICIWMGKPPESFVAWQLSLDNNKDIRFYIMTDHPDEFKDKLLHSHANLYIVQTNLLTIKSIIEKRLNTTISLSGGYKLCDYRPLWFYILSFYFPNTCCSWWGHFDIDAIFNDILLWYGKYLLEDSPYIKVGGDGHLTLYKSPEFLSNYLSDIQNLEIVAGCFSRNSIAFKDVIKNETNLGFDEHWGINLMFSRIKRLRRKQFIDRKLLFDCLPSMYEHYFVHSSLYALMKPVILCVDKFNTISLISSNGKYGKVHQTSYVHFQKLPVSFWKRLSFALSTRSNNDTIFITPIRVIKSPDKVEHLLRKLPRSIFALIFPRPSIKSYLRSLYQRFLLYFNQV